MDTSTKKRLVLGFISNWISKLAGTAIQLVQVPVFLHFWSVALYGEWIIINAIPSYLAFTNIGFGSVASNDMTMLYSAGDRDGALRVFQSCWWLIIGIIGGVGLLLGPVLFFVPIQRLLHLSAIGASDAKWIVFYLGLSVLLGQLEQLLQAAYTCVGRYPYGSFLKSVFSLVAFAAMIVPVVLHHGARTTALVFAVANAAGTLLLCLLIRRDVPWMEYGWRHARWAEIRRMTPLAFAFMGFPIGNALNLQGTLMAVGYVLGPVDVVIFGTARTVSRVALQMVQMVNFTFWPELSLAFGQSDNTLIRTLHRRACQLALLISLVIITAMMTMGPWFLHRWTGGHVPPSKTLLAILLFGVLLYSLWSTSSTLHVASNQHQSLAKIYIFATAVTVVVTVVAARRFGLYGVAWSLVLSEAIMNTYVLPASLRMTGDSLAAFVRDLLTVPHSVRPAALLRRLGRSRPQLES